MNEQRLQPLLDLAGRRVDEAASGVQRRQVESVTEQARLDELRHYLADYEAQQARGSRWQLANQSAFIARLRQAVDQQEQAVDQARQSVSSAVAHWTSQRLDQRRYEFLQDRARSQRAALLARREQRDLDELASRRRSAQS